MTERKDQTNDNKADQSKKSVAEAQGMTRKDDSTRPAQKPEADKEAE